MFRRIINFLNNKEVLVKKNLLFVLMLPIFFFVVDNASALSFELYPVADGHVTKTGSTTIVYATAGYIRAGKTVSSYVAYRAAMKFDLSTIPDNYLITSAVLNLNGPYPNLPYGAMVADLYHSSYDSWVEGDSSIVNVTTPLPIVNDLLVSKSISYPSPAGWTQWDLLASNNWDSATDLTDNALTLVMKGHNESTLYSYYSWYSSNNASLRPFLSINADPISAPMPEPASVALVGLGLSGLLFNRRRK